MRIVNLVFLFHFFLFAIFSPFKYASAFSPTAEDIQLLEKIEEDTSQFFIRQTDKNIGLTKDSSRSGSPSSIAATGFALAVYAISQSHGWIKTDYAYNRILITLKTLRDIAEHKNGFFYHFMDVRTGKRVWTSEASSIDTALLVAGALLAAEYFPDTEIEELANEIYERIDWKWMMNGSDLVCMGWKPESGFLPYYWDSYNELIILQALAIGSPTHPIPKTAWDAWFRREGEYNGRFVIYTHSGSLFTYQYSHAFIDFRELNDKGINYFENSKEATLANLEYSQSFRGEHKGYSDKSWGLSASIGPGGYKAYGGMPGEGLQDGTIAPYASISSIVFTPEQSIKAARFLYDTHKEKLYGNFGFKGAFNLDKRWWGNEYLGIDQGITVLMLENYLNDGIVWKKFMEIPAIKRWLKLTGLKEV